ncbi:MAG: GNAT family N-acetyltransferase [Candidatus Bipolaricaulota bacterium]
MKLTVFTTAADFLDRVGVALFAGEAENSLALGVALQVRNGYQYGPDAPFFACVEDGERIALIALCTPPYNLLLCAEKADPEAIAQVAHRLAEQGVTLPGAHGRIDVVDAFVRAWKAETGVLSSVAMEQRLYKLTEVTRPTSVAGQARWAVADDAAFLTPWAQAFVDEAMPDGPHSDLPTMIGRAIADRRLLVWEYGDVVSMCAQTRPTPHGASVGLVYTPPDLRGRGFATACVAELSQRVLDSGKSFCTLFTNLANPTSNAIYQRIGYQPLGDFREVRFSRVVA